MKKFFTFLVAVMLLVMLPVQAFAAGSASVSGPDVVRAGDTITLRFQAGGGIYGGNGSVSFDSNQLTLQSYSASLSAPWTVEFAGNSFVFYDNSMAAPISGSQTIFQATFQVSSDLQPGTNVAVSFNGITLSDGQSDTGVGTKTYSVTIAEPLSANANLQSLGSANAQISPAFSADTTEYTASVPFSVSKLEITAEAAHPGAVVTVGNTGLTPGGTTDVTVTVKAEDGTTKVYHIKTKRAQDPNYVASANNSLSDLAVEGFLLSPAFTPDRADYAVYLPYETESLKLKAAAADAKAKLTMPDLGAIPVGRTTYEIPVTAENGTVRTYTLTVFRADVFQPGVEPTEPTEPETVPTTEPATEPTTVPTETEEPTTAPTQAPTQPQAPQLSQEAHPSMGVDFWMWILVVIMAFCAGCITILLINGIRRK